MHRDDSTVSGRSVVLKDVLKSVPMEDGSFDRTEGNVVFISLAAPVQSQPHKPPSMLAHFRAITLPK
jgi:hypothetical protein